MQRACLLAIALGVLLRLLSASWHEHPRGDVLLDVGVARSLQQGEGFGAGFQRGFAVVRGEQPLPPLDLADQHPPLWPLAGAALGTLAGSPFGGLKLGSLLAGLLLIALVWRQTDRLVEGCAGARDGLPALAAVLVALSFLMIDASGNGSLYVVQAAGVVALVGAVGAPRPSALRVGLLLGALWLLNHQALVLLPVPLLALLLAAPPGGRRAAIATGVGAIALAALLQVPWWWRNQLAFGDPFYSVNGIYVLWHAGVQPELSLENGVQVARMPGMSVAQALLAGQRIWLAPNVLYLLTTGLMLWPGLLALVASGALPLARAALTGRDRRLLACLLCLLALLAIALAWPDMKLRYCVPLTPLVILLGLRLIAAPPTPGERRLALAVVLLWLAALLGTLGDVTGSEDVPRPERWKLLLLAGSIFLLLPLLLRHRRIGGRRLRLALVTGAAAVPVLAALALQPWPHTTYHSSLLTPDVFGKPKEQQDARVAGTAALARQAALDDGAARMVGPMELLEYGQPALVAEPFGVGTLHGDAALVALLELAGVDHVLVYSGRGWPEGLLPGDTWLDGKLVVVATWSPDASQPVLAAAALSAVRR